MGELCFYVLYVTINPACPAGELTPIVEFRNPHASTNVIPTSWAPSGSWRYR